MLGGAVAGWVGPGNSCLVDLPKPQSSRFWRRAVCYTLLRVCYAWQENVMSRFVKDYEYLGRKTVRSANVYGHVTGTEVKNRQCLCGLLRVLRVYTPKGGAGPSGGPEIRNQKEEARNPTPELFGVRGRVRALARRDMSTLRSSPAMAIGINQPATEDGSRRWKAATCRRTPQTCAPAPAVEHCRAPLDKSLITNRE
jgi:hypothetical protein